MAEPSGVAAYSYPANYTDGGDRAYEVSLPHSCDRWVIASGADPDECITEMLAFIAELQHLVIDVKLVGGWPHIESQLGGFQDLDDFDDLRPGLTGALSDPGHPA